MEAGRIRSRFFFFQAEDGIRDKLVTGVQTCALPISGPGPDSGGSKPGRYGWPHMPEKSGMNAAVCSLAGSAVGTPICPRAGVATAAANITKETKTRCPCMSTYLVVVRQ